MEKQLESPLHNRIANWKKNLIDMSKRNTLLNFKPKRTNSVNFLDDPSNMYKLLVDDENQLNCEKLSTPFSVQISKIQVMAIQELEKKKRIAEETQNYKKILNKLRTAAKTRMNEQGINISYLSFGLLKWKETQTAVNSDFFYAPLLLVPATLKRTSANDPFTLSKFEDEIVINPFLAHMLHEQHGIRLPELEEDPSALNVAELWEEVRDLIANLEDWSVEEDVYLSLFSFNRLVMYKDMETYKDLIEGHPLIREIAGVSDDESRKQIFDHTRIPDETTMDREVPSQEIFNILDADSSQQQAILAAKNGMSFVLQGPPGTGKSQTISNIIAENLANNKKVLFVSEKMAALNVVRTRLENEGLGDFCLEMHSQKANKRQVLDELSHVINKQSSKKHISNDVYGQINVIREKLNTYVEKIHLTREPYGKTVFEVHGTLAKLEDIPELMVDFNISFDTELESIYRLLTDLERYRNSVYNADFHPWEGFNDESFSLELKSRVKIYLSELSKQLSNNVKAASSIEETVGICAATLNELKKAIEILDMAIHSPMPPAGWFDKMNITQIIADAKNYQERFSSFLDDKRKLTEQVRESVLEVEQLEQVYNDLFIESEKLVSVIPEGKRSEVLLNQSEVISSIDGFVAATDKIQSYIETAFHLGISQLENLEELKRLLVYISLLNKSTTPAAEWFDEIRFAEAAKHALVTKTKYEEIEEIRQNLLSKYKSSFLEINAQKALVDFEVKENVVGSFKRNQESVDSFLYDQKSKVTSIFSDLFNKIKLFNTCKAEFEEMFGIPINSVASVDTLELVVGLITKSPRPQESWFNLHNYHDIQSTVREGKNLFEKYQSEYNKVVNLFEEEVYDERIYDIFEKCEGKYQSFMRIFSDSYKKDLKWLKSNLKTNDKFDFDTFHKYVRNVKRVLDYKKSIIQKESGFKSLLGWHYQEAETNWAQIEQAMAVTREIVEWHQDRNVTALLKDLLIRPAGRVKQLSASFNQLKQTSNELRQVIKVLQADFMNFVHLIGGNTATANMEELDASLQVEWQKVESYFKFVDEFASHLQNPRGLSVSEFKKDLKNLTQLNQENQKIEDSYINSLRILGDTFKGKKTDWNKLLGFIDEFANLFKQGITINQEFRNVMLRGGLELPIDEAILRRCIKNIQKGLLLYKEAFPKAFSVYEGPELYWPIIAFSNQLQELKQLVSEWQECFSRFVPYFTRSFSFDESKTALERAVDVKRQKERLDGKLEILKSVFGDRFTGYTTNWEQIFDALAWTDEWHELFVDADIPSKIMDFVSAEGDRDKNELKGILAETQREYDKTRSLEKDFHKYFTISVIFKTDFSSVALNELVEFTEIRLGAIDLLEDWIRYQRLEKHATTMGLNQFMLAIRKEKIGEHTFKDMFQKRFFKLWLDQIYKQEPELYEFDADVMDTDVTTFRKLDQTSNQLNVHRIKEKLETNRNQAIRALAYRRELQIMQAEIGKKKRHYPIRKLLNLTAPLFMEIKPCLLMSPLSVSQFLDASVTQFDVVIFDEASQIFSEDAIGAIVRGKQVIIVGDTKQLPPTNFFHSSMIEEDFDEDEQEEVTYESILDECAHVLPPINLRWHYRSKHESLITFSNQAFYHNNLITFPSSDNGPYLGTEFVYVEDGIYDRGGSKTNKKEAEKIAHLVIEHFRDYPDKSLGVIAFSEAQASAIEAELTLLRNSNLRYERFFQEGVQEEFFVKSLENVQGDERDVVFLSVGYAKAADQTLHYNFGPLSKARGERRLNVAVTRAKYHMKLISSLKPSDLSDTKINENTGLRLLKDYMQAAIDGKLPISMTRLSEREFESPFEEDVFLVLTDLGYKVEPQVGCSGYRIDLAVVDPLNENKFILGIECDGKAYHSSKVARDRDRLRQQVLEGLGWKIYRIWSQEWFKKRRFEITRLKNHLESLRYLV
ncbi:DUF4011 domain-containing protein [Paenibacillus sp. MZ04-78.2]|uniref:DUF4011 domain-containing protein n=1 Tax=Paenibacillus sp. MZ04-78.2 TaxID=2962034 RepID=UPI0020B8ADB8|nr:DUF4011 domain-containing protein [Paenibacillus sp. MZ04-78.2]MCP3776175.1 DUF4011 domain-containing protein [Paenibacillus sp. MZ04-78.2]